MQGTPVTKTLVATRLLTLLHLALPGPAALAAKLDSTVPAAEHSWHFRGRSRATLGLQKLIAQIAPAEPLRVIRIEGPTGSGKDALAEDLHKLSKRAAGPLLQVNCGTLPPALIESLLFGHEKGAFTGATDRHAGYFEQADGGTIVLADLWRLPSAAQDRFFGLLDFRGFYRLGGEKGRTDLVKPDVRVVSTSSVPLLDLVEQGHFSVDFLNRLGGRTAILVPALESPERREDIAVLAAAELERISRLRFADAALRALQERSWPGGVRELNGIIAWLVALHEGEGAVRKREVTRLEEGLTYAALDPPAIVASVAASGSRTGGVVVPLLPRRSRFEVRSLLPPDGAKINIRDELKNLKDTLIIEALRRSPARGGGAGGAYQAAKMLNAPPGTIDGAIKSSEKLRAEQQSMRDLAVQDGDVDLLPDGCSLASFIDDTLAATIKAALHEYVASGKHAGIDDQLNRLAPVAERLGWAATTLRKRMRTLGIEDITASTHVR